MKCGHNDAGSFIGGGFDLQWCPACGALNDGDGWRLPQLAIAIPEILKKCAQLVDLAELGAAAQLEEGELESEPERPLYSAANGATFSVRAVLDVKRVDRQLVHLASIRMTHAISNGRVLCGQLSPEFFGNATQPTLPTCPKCAAELRLRFPEVVAQIEGMSS